MKITSLAVDNLDLLHTLDATEPASFNALGDTLDRDPANVRKTVLRLREEGLVAEDALDLTENGRALTRLITAEGEVLADDATLLLRCDQIEPDPDNARTDPDPFAINALAADILRRSRPGRVGLLHALTVQPPINRFSKWRLRGGHRRLAAIWNLIALEDLPDDAPIPCVLHQGLSDLDAAFMALVENVQREDLHPLDEGAGYARLVREFGVDEARIADAVHKSKKHVEDRIRLVEKLDEDAKRRMRLDPSHDDHLTYAGARKLVQALNPRPKPPVDVSPKEALVLLEVDHRVKNHPSPDTLRHGKQGWSRIEALPVGGAAHSLVEKGLIEIEEGSRGAHGYVRLAPAKAREIALWVAEKDTGRMALWHARAEVLGSGIVGDLERTGRYATAWLNDPIPEEIGPPGAAPRSPSEAQPLSPPPPATAEEARAEPPEPPPQPEIPPYLQRLAGIEEKAATQPELTVAQARIMLDVAASTANDPQPGRPDPATGVPAFHGARAYKYFNDPVASSLVVGLRMLAFVPDAKGRFQMAVITKTGQAWLEAGGSAHAPRPQPPYVTAWLNPPLAEAPPPKPPAAATDPAAPFVYFAKPIIEPPREFTCGNCDADFEISAEIDTDEIKDSPRFLKGTGSKASGEVLDAAAFTVAGLRTAICPHCQAALHLLAAEVYLVKHGDA
jgi:ParB/RepB/Spo0J family partition protein